VFALCRDVLRVSYWVKRVLQLATAFFLREVTTALVYFAWSARYGQITGGNPRGAKELELLRHLQQITLEWSP
jgi:hypothetical protein